MYFDLAMVETGDGGDIVVAGNDIVTVQGIENQPYLCMFSGKDWWGNALLLNNDPGIIFSSETERVLTEVTVNSSGRIRIEEAIKQDLKPMLKANPGLVVQVEVVLAGADRLNINIYLSGEPAVKNWNPPAVVENYIRQLSGIGYWIIEFNFIVS